MRSRTYIATPPGATIKEQLVNRNMSQKEFATRMDMSEKHISKLINGDVQLTPEMAMRLELVLGLPAHFWNNLESNYREKLLKVQTENEMDEDLEIMRKMPYNEMVNNGWIPKTRNPNERVNNLRKFFEVVQLGILKEPSIIGINYRKLGGSENSDYALLAWAQRAKLEARNISVASINVDKLKNYLPVIRSMTTQAPQDFCPRLRNILAECGTVIVFLPHIGGSFLHGAAFYDGPKIVVGVTVRGKDADRFWFSLFHELGHIVSGHLNLTNNHSAETEKVADAFARDILIPQKEYDKFIMRNTFDRGSIRRFSERIEIDPGIVVGRLQKEGYIKFNMFNDMKIRYEISV